MTTYDIVKKMFQEKFGTKVEPKPSDNLLEIGIDSLDLVEFMLLLEEEFKVEFSTEEIADLKFVNDVIELINSKIA